eukprot:6029226-Amphidinium_carterae.1
MDRQKGSRVRKSPPVPARGGTRPSIPSGDWQNRSPQPVEFEERPIAQREKGAGGKPQPSTASHLILECYFDAA